VYASYDERVVLYLTIPVAGEPGLCAEVPAGRSKYPVEEVAVS
jgi:hypothetical protein